MNLIKRYRFQAVGFIAMVLLISCQVTEQNKSLTEAGVSHELAKFRKDNYGQVRYHLFFSIPENRREVVSGKVELLLEMAGKQDIVIDYRGVPEQIFSMLLNNKPVVYSIKDEHIRIEAEYVCPGVNKVEIEFNASDQSLNRRDEFLYTLLVPDRARTVFPCFDQPDLKSLFSLSLELPESWQAVSNGAVERVDSITVAGRKRITFRETEPLSTYLFSFVAGKLSCETFSRNGRDISVYHRETDPEKIAQCPEIAGEVFDALEWLERYTDIPYPFAKYDLIILPGFQYGGMEHTGATLYNDRRMFLNENPTLDERLGRSSLIAHETAHMWFGDYVTMAWFDDVWTKEVFANYFASRVVEPVFPYVDHRLNFMLDYIPSAYAEDRTAGSNPIKQELDNLRNAGLVYGNIIYTKSPVVLSMLIRMMGENAFQQGIREYLKTYAYGNATWEGLIDILDKYTERDLKTWSQVWVNEKGMPEIYAEIKGDSLIVSQQDSWGRGLCWPQTLSYRLFTGDRVDTIQVSFRENEPVVREKLSFPVKDDYTLVPNADGMGYGFFRLGKMNKKELVSILKNSRDEVLRGSLLITLNENFLNRVIPSGWYLDVLQDYLPGEENPLLFSMALKYIGNCQHMYPDETGLLEETLWNIVSSSENMQFRLQAFRVYYSLAGSPEAIDRVYRIWKERQNPAGCSLSENDYIGMSYALAVRLPEKADELLAVQQARIMNPDRKREYAFVSPSVSPNREVRDSVFASLLNAENRRIEPWASVALSNLNHRLRQKEAVGYIRPALGIMQEVQRTGDIFFPRDWARALLGGHTSVEARKEVDAFFAEHPDFPVMLSNKIRQQADHLYRLHE